MIELLLADADTGRQSIEGIEPSASERAPRPRAMGGLLLGDYDGDPNDLALQGWGVLAPEGPAGDRLLAAIDALIKMRSNEQGAPARVYRAAETYLAEDEHDRPRYLLMLGDLTQLSLELQQRLSRHALVGRLHIGGPVEAPDLAGYEAYAAKAVRAPPSAPAGALYHVAADGSPATVAGKAKLFDPALAYARDAVAQKKLAARAVTEVPPEDLLAVGRASQGDVLLNISHGLGAPQGGWRSLDEQHARQGVLKVGIELLDAAAVSQGPFLSGGAWLSVACFGAATPSDSAYSAWLQQLADLGVYREPVARVCRSLPKCDEPPFLSAVPQAALKNPDGPLAFIGHVDLAWSAGFSDPSNPAQSRAQPFTSALSALIRGKRSGLALDHLMRGYQVADDALLASYNAEQKARARKEPDPTNFELRGRTWMQRNDLRAYILLGDPACRVTAT